jgi:DNA-binding response OmpR family regulator
VGEVLVVDDDQTLASVVVDYLRRAGHAVGHADDGFQALRAVTERDVELVILDVMLPGLDGLEVCRRMRRSTPLLPVVMLTALGEVDDRIAGLEVGADDYVTKPFSPRELVLRVESVLRRTSRSRSEPPGLAEHLTAGPVRIDARSRRAYKNDVELSLTVREFDLLAFLLAHPGQAYSREQLMREVWGWTFGDQSTVTVHVRRLREKIEDDPTRPALIQTVWGIGYRLDPP